MRGWVLRAGLVVAGVAGGAAGLVRVHAWLCGFDTSTYDIFYLYTEGGRLLAGENPYARVLDGDMRKNNKYATYLPLFYLLAAATRAAGLEDYGRWISLWRLAFVLFGAGVGTALFEAYRRRGAPVLGVLAAALSLLNRWSLHVAVTGQIDFVGVFFLVASLLLFGRHRVWSCLLLGVSLALKQVAIFVVPLYFIWAWQDGRRNRWRETLRVAAAIAAVPLVLSIPFIAWNPEGFVRSILFSLTRSAGGPDVPSLDAHLRLDGLPARVMMLAVFVVLYEGVLERRIGRSSAALLAMSVFIGLNTVLFAQYVCWVMALVPLAILESIPPSAHSEGATDTG